MKLLVLICFLLTNLSSFGQSATNAALPKIIPTSPEVASLGKYGDIPIGYQTGTADISIPLASLKQADVSLNVSLSYHTGGNKVEEIASSVGMGWSLRDVGGTISRTQRGLPDEEYFYGYFKNHPKATKYFNGQMNGVEEKDYIKNIVCGYMDGEADIFYLNIEGFSGKFFMASDSNFHTIPKSNLKINFDYGTHFWTIINEKGNKYFFNIFETATVEPYCNGSNNSQMVSTNAWHLTKILDKANDSVIFNYYYEYTQRIMQGNDEYGIVMGGNGDYPNCIALDIERNYCVNDVKNSGYRVVQIKSKLGRIIFIPNSTSRQDYIGSYALDYIAQLNNNNDTIKKIKFYTSYFNGNRLRLDSTHERKGLNKNETHSFVYNENLNFPDILSSSQDYWGFYNGAPNNTLVQYQTTLTGPFVGANRNVNPNYSKVGILEQIKYPTGGRAEFLYENNVYSKDRIPGLDFEELTTYFSFNGSNASPSNNPAVVSSNFQVTQNDIVSALGYLVIKMDLNYFCANPTLQNQFFFTVIGNNGYSNNHVSNGDVLNLPIGLYTVTGSIETEYANMPYCTFNANFLKVKWDTRNKKNYYGGGLRIKGIKKYYADNTFPFIDSFIYNYPNDTISSGFLSGEGPIPLPYETKRFILSAGGLLSCLFKNYSASSTYPLLETSGKPVVYEYVEKKEIGNLISGHGNTLKQFSTYNNHPDIVYTGFPFLPAEDHSWRRGNLTAEKISKFLTPNTNSLINEIKRGYISYNDNDSNPNLAISKNIKVGVLDTYNLLDCTSSFEFLWNNRAFSLAIGAYRNITEPFSIKSDTSITYSNTSSLQNIKQYGFNDKNYMSFSDSVKNSKNETLVTKSKFVKDYTNNSLLNNFVSKLLEKNRVVEPIEQLYIFTKNGQTYLKRAELTSYNILTLLPDSIFVFETIQPILLNSFLESYLNISGYFVKDSRYKLKIVFSKYDAARNVTEVKKEYDEPVSYLYGYKSSYPVVLVIGSNHATVSSLVNQSILDNPSNAQELSTELNKVRTGLIGTKALVTTFTYAPLIGITSETDPNNRTKYYEYDNFNRLSLIRDQDNNILKKICYNYAGQVEDCPLQ